MMLKFNGDKITVANLDISISFYGFASVKETNITIFYGNDTVFIKKITKKSNVTEHCISITSTGEIPSFLAVDIDELKKYISNLANTVNKLTTIIVDVD